MIDINELRRLTQAATPGPWIVNASAISELLDRLEAAESEAIEQARLNGMGAERELALMAKLEAAEKAVTEAYQRGYATGQEESEKERDALRAKLEAMERQEPVAWMGRGPRDGRIEFSVDKPSPSVMRDFNMAPLYALPGAQPAPSVPDWLPVPDKHPTFDPVDLQFADGSVLCGCVPQVDGDYWWEGPSGEVFIDPRYAPVTHWRLSAEPEAKP